MNLSERVEQLYFKKFDDQMGGLTKVEQLELSLINIVINSPVAKNVYDDFLKTYNIENVTTRN